ncbi:DUF6491 family protein [Phenylobacterium deserti]|uniref:DUF3617 domain-containing protein n=1 Tax=Phenylobacterium deserti TaxID=1914756 RepID=A0A328APR7_9CAUL|nr:DUF6491 family protein [Phenylobacterium deserti]RAK57012.1 hypothetical protein DJ018_03360 [Phenylobacterium deserti]
MKTLVLSAAIAMMASAPSFAASPQVFDWGAHARAYLSPGPSPQASKQCFNGKFIQGANRSGANTIYVQPQHGGIFAMQLEGSCEALNSAEKLTIRSAGGDVVCVDRLADVVAHTPAGAKRCRATGVRRLTSPEIASLSTAR